MANPTEWFQPASTPAILIALLSASCSLFQPPGAAYDRARVAYLEGDLYAAIQQASAGAARYGADPKSPWGWQFKLLEAEALTAQSRANEANALLGAAVPAGAALSQFEVRRLIDRTQVASARERPGLLAQARAAATDPELKIRIKLLEGASLLTTSQDAGQTQFREALAMSEGLGNFYWQASALSNLSYS